MLDKEQLTQLILKQGLGLRKVGRRVRNILTASHIMSILIFLH